MEKYFCGTASDPSLIYESLEEARKRAERVIGDRNVYVMQIVDVLEPSRPRWQSETKSAPAPEPEAFRVGDKIDAMYNHIRDRGTDHPMWRSATVSNNDSGGTPYLVRFDCDEGFEYWMTAAQVRRPSAPKFSFGDRVRVGEAFGGGHSGETGIFSCTTQRGHEVLLLEKVVTVTFPLDQVFPL